MGLKEWQEASQETIDTLKGNELTSNDSLMLASAMIILSHDPNAAKNYICDFVPNSQIDELMQELLNAFVEYTKCKSQYQITPVESNKENMLQKFDVILDMQRQIFDMLYRSSDVLEERQILKDFFADRVKKHNMI